LRIGREWEETDKLICKGVVHSEMQGALSSPQEALGNKIYSSLFPGTTYAFVSGGDPEAIPLLTQENFEKFYSATVRGYRYQYEYRTFDGKLYGCVGKSLEDCRARVQQMISNTSK
jgi:hypothetical protein